MVEVVLPTNEYYPCQVLGNKACYLSNSDVSMNSR